MLAITPIETWVPAQEQLGQFFGGEIWCGAEIVRVPFRPQPTTLVRASITAEEAAEYIKVEWSVDGTIWTAAPNEETEIYTNGVQDDAKVQIAFDDTGIPNNSYLRATIKGGAPWMNDTSGRQCAGGLIRGLHSTEN